MKRVIDTDPGVDDGMAILYATLAPEIELVALTTTFGNVAVERATCNALWLTEMAGLDIPVSQGAANPLSVGAISLVAFIHGDEGLGPVAPATPGRQAHHLPAHELLCDLARAHKGELAVRAIGMITNVAPAIRHDPEFARNVARILFMGGAYAVAGNVTPFAEANASNDPAALDVVVASGAEVVMVGLDVTMQALCDQAHSDRLARAHPDLGGSLRDASRLHQDRYEANVGTRGWSLHDPAAVIACAHPDLFQRQRLPIAVVEGGEEIGRTIHAVDPNRPAIAVSVGGNMEAVKARFEAVFGVS